MTKKLRPLTEQEINILKGMMNATPKQRAESQGPYLRNITEEERSTLELRNSLLLQNHKWPWDEEGNKQ